MTVAASDIYFDPFDLEIRADPYPVYRRLRDEAPLYYNAAHDFYAVTRFSDVQRFLTDHETFISSKGGVLDVLKAGIEMPPAMFIFEDPPVHTKHRGVVSRIFTPRSMSAIEPQIRQFCVKILDSLLGAPGFDFVHDIGALVPMRVVGMLLGVPDGDQVMLRDHFEKSMQGVYDEARSKSPLEGMEFSFEMFGQYINWRADHPSDDLMTQMLTIEFEDETGTTRRLTREEILTYVTLIAAAGNDTTNRLIGWTGKVLGDHPDERRKLVEDPSLIPNAIEEILRFEAPPYHMARFVARDAEFHRKTVPAGSILVCLPGAANRDERRFPDPDRFDVNRTIGHILSFGYGAHHCLGAALARLEGRVVLEEVLKRFPDWEVDHRNARLTDGFLTRGWETLPVSVSDAR
jgi:cytochrome P450